MSSGIPPIMSCQLSFFSHGEVVGWWDYYWWCSNDCETIFSRRFDFRVEVNFVVGVNFYHRKLFREKIVVGEKIPPGHPPETIIPSGQHLIHYWDAIFPGRCPGIGWYLCTYDDTDLISLYVKVWVNYGMFSTYVFSMSQEISPTFLGGHCFL